MCAAPAAECSLPPVLLAEQVISESVCVAPVSLWFTICAAPLRGVWDDAIGGIKTPPHWKEYWEELQEIEKENQYDPYAT
jgi:hypothetical protein